jgi:hypothetical protein
MPLAGNALRRVHEALQDPEFYAKLVAHVLAKMHILYWWLASGRNLPGGKNADDIAQQAVNDLLDGHRAWNLAVQPSLFKHLCDIADSILNGHVESWETRMIRAMSPLAAEDAEGEEQPSFLETVDPLAMPADEDVRIREAAAASIQKVQAFLASLHDDLSCLELARTLAFGVDDPKRAAAVRALNLSSKDYDNVRKRLARRWLKFDAAYAAQPAK